MTMIIPAKGYNIKILLKDIKDFHLRKMIRENYPEAIYKGKLDTIENNTFNRVF